MLRYIVLVFLFICSCAVDGDDIEPAPDAAVPPAPRSCANQYSVKWTCAAIAFEADGFTVGASGTAWRVYTDAEARIDGVAFVQADDSCRVDYWRSDIVVDANATQMRHGFFVDRADGSIKPGTGTITHVQYSVVTHTTCKLAISRLPFNQ